MTANISCTGIDGIHYIYIFDREIFHYVKENHSNTQINLARLHSIFEIH